MLFKYRMVMLAGLIILSFIVGMRLLENFDINVTKSIQGFILQKFDAGSVLAFDYITLFFTIIGSGEITGIIALLIAGMFLAHKRPKDAFFFLFFFGLSVVIELALKNVVPQPKVFSEFRRGLMPPIPIYSPFTLYAYPSGHATRTIILMGIVYYFISNLEYSKIANNLCGASHKFLFLLAKISIVLTSFFMLISRVYEGAHWTCDIIGGIFLGSYLLLAIIEKIKPEKVKISDDK